MNPTSLTFGVYPLGAVGTPSGLAKGPIDDFDKIQLALKDLQGDAKRVIPRMYIVYTKEWESEMLSNIAFFRDDSLLGDLCIVLGDWTKKQGSDIELDHWLNFIKKVIHDFGSHLGSLQITNEPNLPFMEGSNPHIIQALVEGVVVAKKQAQKLKLPINIGFGSVPSGDASVPYFWENLTKEGNDKFVKYVDFIGHNFYVDVFGEQTLALQEVPSVVEHTLRSLREVDLVKAGIPNSVPIRITENGWSTGKKSISDLDRSYEHQSKVLETVIRTVYSLRSELNISHFELFGLRDANSSIDDLFHQFGVMRDDYSPKPAYYTFKRLIRELG